MRHEVTLPVAAPVELVWRTISEIERWPEWTPTMTSVESSSDNGLRIGETARVKQPGQRERTWKITDLVPGESFVWEAKDRGGLVLAASHRAVAADDGTAVAELGFTASGPTAWLAGLMAGRTIRRAVETEARSLKDWCEKHA